MNINRKRKLLKNIINESDVPLNIPTGTPALISNIIRITSALTRFNIIRARKTNPFDVLDMTQAGNDYEREKIIISASGGDQ